MKILIVTLGTRGDVQPYIALGRALMTSGNDVTICTCAHFEPFVREYGLGYAYVNNDFIDFMHTPEGKILLGNAGSAWETLITLVRMIPKFGNLQERQMADVWEACKDSAPDLILYHMKALGAPDFAEKLGVPCMLAFWLPLFVPTTRFPAMGFPDLPLGPGYRWLTYQFIRRMMIISSKRVRQWRKQHGLPLSSPGLRMQLPDGRPIPALHGFSRHIIPPPEDWDKTATVTGYWFLNQDENWNPPKSLTDFLSRGEPPVYFGFGSIFGRDPKHTTQIILEAVRRTGVRAVLAQGWGGLEPADFVQSESIMFIEAAPHNWLFPQVSAVVHHGGCGTTAAGLLAGKPNIICPFFGDQPFWGRHVERLGIGPSPIPQKRLTVERLCHAIDVVMNDSTMRQNAAALGNRLQKENGTSNAVEFINQWMSNEFGEYHT
ncbi:MAG: glycosyltransferase family 1 protein [Deltaproteobacteria bacterium]|nr:glycosyltransferase family 1 protein [Candidatus Desulfobacula maris]